MIGRRQTDANGEIVITPAQRFDRLERIVTINVAMTAVLIAIRAQDLLPLIQSVAGLSSAGHIAVGVSAVGVGIAFRGLIG